ncbi:uncharacterized protein LOC142784783 [Rhipicephalus microplus]|uniref:uncharacterized protein LOC142784783 n=1 Tax=Rhipicephalus microplus TaxID=6941 RepID=UPI003F6B154F
MLVAPYAENAYTTPKQLLSSRLMPSEPQRLQQLVHDTELGDRTPSQLLGHINQLLHTASATTTDADSRLLREQFLQRLPVNVRMVLTSAANKRLSQLAELADLVLAVAPPSVAMQCRPAAISRSAYVQQCNKEPPGITGGVATLLANASLLATMRQTGAAGTEDDKCPRGLERRLIVFFFTDRDSGLRFPVDTGTEVSVVLFGSTYRHVPSVTPFQVVNNTTITTYGHRLLPLDLDRWILFVAAVKVAILGADFFRHVGLFIGVHNHRLHDPMSQATMQGDPSKHPPLSSILLGPSGAKRFTRILREFPELTR